MTANIQGESAEDVAHKVASNPITRGLQGPTIAPIYAANGNHTNSTNSQWYTLTVIISNNELLQAVEHLRAIGGTHTIAVPVRYVFMEESPTYANLLKQLS